MQFFPKSPKYRKPIIVVGIVIMVIALVLASFADTAAEIVIFQGMLFGIGGILLNFVHISVFSEWFVQKKGQAMGIIWCGWRVGALAFPPICQWLLQKHGYEQTLRVLIAPMLALLVPSIILLRGRYPSAAVSSKAPTDAVSKWRALRTPNVLFYLFTDILFTLVVNVPMMFITKYAHDLGLSGSEQALSLSLLVLSNMLGTYCFSWLSDKVFHQGLTSTCAIAVGLIHFLLLGFAKSRAAVLAYVLLVGIPIGGWSKILFLVLAVDNRRQDFATVFLHFSRKYRTKIPNSSLQYMVYSVCSRGYASYL